MSNIKFVDKREKVRTNVYILKELRDWCVEQDPRPTLSSILERGILSLIKQKERAAKEQEGLDTPET